jgi:hypothetical protein
MNGFFIRSMLFLSIGGILVRGMEFVSRQWPPNFTQLRYVDQIETVLEEADRLETLVFGNSHADVFDWTEMGVNGMDLGLPWNEAMGVEHQVRTLVDDLPRLHTAVVAISPITFRWENRLAGDASYLFGRRLFHALTPFSGFVNGDWHSYVRGQLYWLVREDNWYRVMLGIAGRDPYEEERNRYHSIHMDTVPDTLLAEHAEDRVRNKVRLQEAMIAEHPGLSEEGYQALSAAVGELQARGIRVILLTPPYHPRYVQLYEENPAWVEMQVLARRLAVEHGIRWYDFSSDELALDHTNFRDSDHLNDRGKAHFSRRFLERICHDSASTGVAEQRFVCR